MNRKQFMEQLERLLSDISEAERRHWNIMKDILMMQVLRMKEK